MSRNGSFLAFLVRLMEIVKKTGPLGVLPAAALLD